MGGCDVPGASRGEEDFGDGGYRFLFCSMTPQQLRCSHSAGRTIAEVFWIYRSGQSTTTSPFNQNVHFKLFKILFLKNYLKNHFQAQLLNAPPFAFVSPRSRKL